MSFYIVLNFELTRLFIERDFYEVLDTKSRRRTKSTLAQINLQIEQICEKNCTNPSAGLDKSRRDCTHPQILLII